jgi:hypothetical protein
LKDKLEDAQAALEKGKVGVVCGVFVSIIHARFHTDKVE